MAYLISFVVVTALITVVGHGLWIVARAVVLELRSGTSRKFSDPKPCPRCRSSLDSAGTCRRCGWIAKPPTKANCLLSAARLEELYLRGTISPLVYRTAVEALRVAQAEADAARVQSPAQADQPVRPAPVSEGTAPVSQETVIDAVISPSAPEVPPTPAAPPIPAVPSASPFASSAPSPRSPERPVVATPAHPLEAPEPEPKPPVVRPALGAMLQAFMEKRNIQWGELASGILVVGSAIGLVISLRETLRALSEQIPFFPALLLMLGTAAFQGAGIYTLKYWRLRSTSRGVLIIGLLLVPLSFAAGLVLSGSGASRVPMSSPWYWLALSVGLVGYGMTVVFSARALDKLSWFPLSLGVLGPAVGQLVIDRLEPQDTSLSPFAVHALRFALPLATYLVALLLQLRQVVRKPQISKMRIERTWLVVGTATFSLAVSTTWLVLASAGTWSTLAEVTPWLTLASSGLAIVALAIFERCGRPSLAVPRVTALALTFLTALAMLGLLALAWPRVDLLVLNAVLVALVCAVLAGLTGMVWLWSVVTLATSCAVLLLVHRLGGTLPWRPESAMSLWRAIGMGRSAGVLLGCGAAALLTAGVAVSRRRPESSRPLLLASVVLVAVSYGIACYAGFWGGGDLNAATAVLAVTAIALVVACRYEADVRMEGIASALWLVFWAHVCFVRSDWIGTIERWGFLVPDRALAALWTHAITLAPVWAIVSGVGRKGGSEKEVGGVATTTVGTATLAGVLLLLHLEEPPHYHAGVLAGTALVYWLGFVTTRADGLFAAADGVMALVVMLTTVALVTDRVPQDRLGGWWTERRVWELIVAALSMWCLFVAAVSWWRQRWSRLARLLPWSDFRTSSILAVLLATALLGLAEQASQAAVAHDLKMDCPPLLSDRLAEIWVVIGDWTSPAALLSVLATGWWLRMERRDDESLAVLVLTSLAAIGFVSPPAAGWQASLVTLMTLTGLAVLSWNVLWSIPAGRRWCVRGGESVQRRVLGMRGLVFAIGGGTVAFVACLALSQLVRRRIPAAPDWVPADWRGLFWIVPLASVGAAGVISSLSDRRWYGMALAVPCFHLLAALCVAFSVATATPKWSLAEVFLRHADATLLVGGLLSLAWAKWHQHSRLGEAGSYQPCAVYLTAVGMAAILCGVFLFDGVWLRPAGWTLDPQPMWLGAVGATLWLGSIARISSAAVVAPAAIGAGVRFALVAFLIVSLAPLFEADATWMVEGMLIGWTAITVGTAAWAIWKSVAARADSWTPPQTAGPLERRSGLQLDAVLSVGLVCLALLVGMFSQRGFWRNASLVLPVLMAVLAGLGVGFRRRVYGYGVLLLGFWEGAVLGIELPGWPAFYRGDFIWFPLLGTLVGASLWLAIERWYQMRGEPEWAGRVRSTGPHVIGSWTVLLMAALFSGIAIVALLMMWSRRLRAEPLLATGVGSATLGVMAATFVALLYDRFSRGGFWGLLISGGVILIAVVERAARSEPLGDAVITSRTHLLVALSLVLAVYLTLWSEASVHLQRRASTESSRQSNWRRQWWWSAGPWLAALVGSITIGALLVFPLTLTSQDRALRIVAGLLPLMGLYSAARLSNLRWPIALRTVALVFGGWMMVALGWAAMSRHGFPNGDVRYIAQLAIVVLVTGVLYGSVVPRAAGAASLWHVPARRVGLVMLVCGAATCLVLVVREAGLFASGQSIPLDIPRLVVLSLVMVVTSAGLLVMAAMPERDPLRLSERGRMGYVYAAQFCLALAFAHVYFVKPQWFQLALRPYWPYVVVLIAFAGVGIGEWARRRGLRVLGEPLQTTGGFLPVVPAVGVWLDASQTQHAPVYFFAGMLYVCIAALRKSFGSAIAAAVFGNAAYWILLKDAHVPFAAQPQLWLIPPAVAVLAAAELNRTRLRPAQLTATRYICVMLIYLSSSGETFMKLLAPDSPSEWLRPLILLALSVAGIFAGILLRVRAFLFLGFGFLLLGMIAMVWSSSRLVHHTWPWWAFGVAMGIGILVLFGIFEKHRDRIKETASRLQEWEP